MRRSGVRASPAPPFSLRISLVFDGPAYLPRNSRGLTAITARYHGWETTNWSELPRSRPRVSPSLSFLKTGSGGHTVRLGCDGDRLSESLAIASSTFHHRGDDNRGIRGSVNRIDAKEVRRRQSGTIYALERRTHRSGSQPLVTMMETADLWKGDYFACFGGLDRPWHGRVLVQR